MPVHLLSLPDVEQSVSRPVIYAIIDQIFDITKMSKETRINYAGKNGTLGTPGTTLDEQSKEAIFANDRYTFVDVDETYQPGALQETHLFSHEHRAIFIDAETEVTLRPIYLTSDVVIQIRYHANSETEARRWYADMALKASMGRDCNLHTVSYKYSIPFPFVGLLEDIWKLREATAPYGESFKEYITNHASPRLTLFANRAGEKAMLGVSETQTRIIGLFDIQGIPELPVRESSTGSWEITFSYKFSYQRPDAVMVEYPIAVHNSFIPRGYLDESVKEDDPSKRETYNSKSYEALSAFECDKTMVQTRPSLPYFRIPAFDDFTIPCPLQGMATIFTALCFLDDGRQDLLNLAELGDIVIDSDILAFIKAEAPYITDEYKSLFHVEVYRNNANLPKETFTVDSNLNIKFTAPMDPRFKYRVRLACVVRINMLQWSSIERLGNYPKAAVKLLSSMNELLRLNPDFVYLGDLPHLEEWHLTYLYWVLTGRQKAPTSSYIWNDVNISNFTGNAGDRFTGSIDSKTLKSFYETRTNTIGTKQLTTIIAERLPNV